MYISETCWKKFFDKNWSIKYYVWTWKIRADRMGEIWFFFYVLDEQQDYYYYNRL